MFTQISVKHKISSENIMYGIERCIDISSYIDWISLVCLMKAKDRKKALERLFLKGLSQFLSISSPLSFVLFFLTYNLAVSVSFFLINILLLRAIYSMSENNFCLQQPILLLIIATHSLYILFAPRQPLFL
jgi:hypothetical protein